VVVNTVLVSSLASRITRGAAGAGRAGYLGKGRKLARGSLSGAFIERGAHSLAGQQARPDLRTVMRSGFRRSD